MNPYTMNSPVCFNDWKTPPTKSMSRNSISKNKISPIVQKLPNYFPLINITSQITPSFIAFPIFFLQRRLKLSHISLQHYFPLINITSQISLSVLKGQLYINLPKSYLLNPLEGKIIFIDQFKC
jgi:hypothetical protein